MICYPKTGSPLPAKLCPIRQGSPKIQNQSALDAPTRLTGGSAGRKVGVESGAASRRAAYSAVSLQQCSASITLACAWSIQTPRNFVMLVSDAQRQEGGTYCSVKQLLPQLKKLSIFDIDWQWCAVEYRWDIGDAEGAEECAHQRQ